MTAHTAVQSFHIPLTEIGDRALAQDLLTRAIENRTFYAAADDSRGAVNGLDAINYSGRGLTEILPEIERRAAVNPDSILHAFLHEVNKVLAQTGGKQTLETPDLEISVKTALLINAAHKLANIHFKKASPAETDAVILLVDFARLAKTLAHPKRAHAGDRLRQGGLDLHKNRGDVEKELREVVAAIAKRQEPEVQKVYAILNELTSGAGLSVEAIVKNWDAIAARPVVARAIGMMGNQDSCSL